MDKKIKLIPLILLIFLISVVSASATSFVDTFTRVDNTNLGVNELNGSIWGEAISDSYIASNSLIIPVEDHGDYAYTVVGNNNSLNLIITFNLSHSEIAWDIAFNGKYTGAEWQTNNGLGVRYTPDIDRFDWCVFGVSCGNAWSWSPSASTIYMLRLNRTDGVNRAKIWSGGYDDEPASFQFNYSTGSVTGDSIYFEVSNSYGGSGVFQVMNITWGENIDSLVVASPLSITATNQYNSSSLSNFSAEIGGVGTFYTNNGTITTPLLQNDTSLYNIILSSPYYFNKTYLNYNVSSDLSGTLFQSILSLSPLEIFTNNALTGGNFSIGSYKISQNDPLYLSAGVYNVTYSNSNYFNKSALFTVSALENQTNDLNGVFDSLLNITAINGRNSASITSFSISAVNGTYTASGTTTGSKLNLGVKKDLTYNISINALGFERKSASVLINTTFYDYGFSLYPANSLLITIRKETDNSLITDNITMNFITNSSENLYYTNNGSFYISDLNSTEYGILFNGSGYSVRTYTITVANGSVQSLTAYLTTGVSTTLFTIKDQNTDEILSGVLSTMFRFINGSWSVVESKYTDITGKVQFSYLPYTNYKFYLAKTNYDNYVFYLNPILFSTYSVGMTKSTTTEYAQDFDRISIIYSPTTYNYGESTPFNWIITSPSGELINYGFTLIYPGGTSSQNGLNAIGGQLSTVINITSGNVFDRVQLNYFYETTTSGIRNFTFYYPIVFPYGGNNTFLKNRDNTYGMGLFERVLIATVIFIFVLGIASLVGQLIPGLAITMFIMGYLVFIGFIPLWLVLVSLLFGVFMLIWKSGG